MLSEKPGLIATAMAVAFVFATLYFDRDQTLSSTVIRFLDPDDALRLAQVRSLMAGGNWFDPVIASIGDGGLHSHWSRLLDLPIAGLILAAGQFVDQARAEQIALILWPKLVLLAFMVPLLRLIIRETGVEAAAALLPMLWLSIFALVNFQLTRIDHHNVQNACAVLAIILATSPLASPRSAFAAGLIAGLGLAIGYEALPAMGLLAALMAACSLLADDRRRLGEGFAAGLALALAGTFVATVRPTDWLSVPCDALGLNVVAGAVIGAIGLFAAGRLAGAWTLRLASLAVVGVTAAAAFVAIEPVCLGGPFAKVDPAQWPLWMAHVNEAKSLFQLGETKASLAVGLGLSMLICLAAQIMVTWRSRSLNDILRLVMLLAISAVGFRYVKMLPYSQYLGLYCLARAAFVLPMPHRQLTPRSAAMLAILFTTPVPLMLLASAVLPAEKSESAAEDLVCAAQKDYGALASMPPARILPQPDLGGYLALFSQHQSMIGNYHRLDSEIMRASKIFAAPMADARAMLDAWKIDLVVHCQGRKLYGRQNAEGSLGLAIERGVGVPDYLVPIDLGVAGSVKAWRVARP